MGNSGSEATLQLKSGSGGETELSSAHFGLFIKL